MLYRIITFGTAKNIIEIRSKISLESCFLLWTFGIAENGRDLEKIKSWKKMIGCKARYGISR